MFKTQPQARLGDGTSDPAPGYEEPGLADLALQVLRDVACIARGEGLVAEPIHESCPSDEALAWFTGDGQSSGAMPTARSSRTGYFRVRITSSRSARLM